MATSPNTIRFALAASAALALPAGGCLPPEEELPLEPYGETTGEGDPAPTTEGDVLGPCPAEHGPTLHRDNVTADEVWRAEDGPHVVANDLTIQAPVTVEACARVRLGASTTLSIGAGGSFRAEGRADDGQVIIERLDPDAAWSTIQIAGGTMTLEHALVVGGGDPLNREPFLHGAIIVRGPDDATFAEPVLTVRDVAIEDSASQGVRLFDQGAFAPGSEGLVITGAAGHPVSVEADSAGGIPTGAYTGNGDDRILLTTTDPIVHDITLAERGVPYLVGSPQEVADLRVFLPGGLATLTIEPGVELQFGRGGVMRIEPAVGEFPAQGALVAIGTEDAPIVLTSAEQPPAAGDWLGLRFGGTLAAHDVLAHARVEYAGGDGSSGTSSCVYPDEDPDNHAAIRIAGVPPGPFITHTTVVASARHGIDRGWRDDVVVDFLPTNDLDDVARCRQSYPQAWTGECPDPVPCD